MKKMIRSMGVAVAAMVLAGAAMAGVKSAETVTKPMEQGSGWIDMSSLSHQMYMKGGFAGVGLGYALGVNDRFTARTDFTTLGSYSKSDNSGDFAYDGKFKYDQLSVYGDYFPFAGSFRVTGGLNFRDAKLEANARPNTGGEVTIGDATVGYGPGDAAMGRIKMPSVAPYIGIGWGHNVSSATKGFSFIADIGVSIGKPKVEFNVNDNMLAKLDAATGGNGQAEVNKQLKDLKDDADKLKVVPQVYIGVAYKF